MEYQVVTGNPAEQTVGCLIAGVHEEGVLSPVAERLDQASSGYLKRLIDSGDLKGRLGQTVLLREVPGLRAERLLLVGCGKQEEFSDSAFQKAVQQAAQVVKETGAPHVLSALIDLSLDQRSAYWKVRLHVATWEDGYYRFDATKSKKEPPSATQFLGLWIENPADQSACERATAEAAAVAAGTHLAKELSNLPGNICTPTYLADQAVELASQFDKLEVSVLEEAQMKELGMGALLSVSRGSRQPAKLIVLEYRGSSEQQKPIALVGKGLTFDAGGISLKPAADMDEMKYDMCGGASVLGTFRACAELDLPVHLIGLVPASENLPDGDANKPGDIVTTMSGQTVEILNTDAEGRLILCDALTYAERFDPDAVIDIATLTGACVTALGAHASGLMGNNEQLTKELLAAGQACGDRAWALPLWDEYQEQLDSNFADMANVGGRPAGAITAACFLSRYTKKYHWAHLDIAGVAWKSGKEKGATGRPVPLLTQYILDRSRS